MPCSDGGPSYSQTRDDSAELSRLRAEVKNQDSMLCSACRVLQKIGFDFDENPRLSEWWDKHKKEDEKKDREETRKRLNYELALAASKKPVSKLTAEDKILLKREGFL